MGLEQADGNELDILAEGEYDWAETDPSTAVVEAVAAVENTDPVALATQYDMTLYDHVNPEALDRLVADDRANDPRVTFPVADYVVRIEEGSVTVAEPADTRDDSG